MHMLLRRNNRCRQPVVLDNLHDYLLDSRHHFNCPRCVLAVRVFLGSENSVEMTCPTGCWDLSCESFQSTLGTPRGSECKKAKCDLASACSCNTNRGSLGLIPTGVIMLLLACCFVCGAVPFGCCKVKA